MAFYRAQGGMWEPPKRIAYEQNIPKNKAIEVVAPYTGSYLIVTSMASLPPVTGGLMEGTDINYVYGSSQSNSSYCSWDVRYIAANKLLYAGQAWHTSSTSTNFPSLSTNFFIIIKNSENVI